MVKVSSGLLLLPVRIACRSHALLQAGLDEDVEVAVEHLLRVADLDVGAQVLDPALVEHVAPDLVAPADVGLGVLERSSCAPASKASAWHRSSRRRDRRDCMSTSAFSAGRPRSRSGASPSDSRSTSPPCGPTSS